MAAQELDYKNITESLILAEPNMMLVTLTTSTKGIADIFKMANVNVPVSNIAYILKHMINMLVVTMKLVKCE